MVLVTERYDVDLEDSLLKCLVEPFKVKTLKNSNVSVWCGEIKITECNI